MTELTAPTKTKKLFAVEITYKAYAWAEDEIEAEDLARDIVDAESYTDIVISEATSNVLIKDQHSMARAAIREVAAWLDENTGGDAAWMLTQEAGR